ncbi:MAG: hypothetical protein FWE05_10600 [Defluviitaleaceae bacterium]|nr:hypothetical protein [Defluviitaleaceae bacterium]
MKIIVVAHNILYPCDQTIDKELIHEVEIFEETTIQQMLDSISISIADLSEYYALSGIFTFNTIALPYVVSSDGKVYWNMLYADTKVKDFLVTHNICDNTIVVKTGHIQAGGPGFIKLYEIWMSIYPIIDQFVTVTGLIAIVGGAGKWVHSLFKGKKEKYIPPQSYFDLIFSRKEWNHFELADFLEVNKDDAKQLLQVFGYQYNPSRLLYVQQKESLALREKLSKINVLDI